MSPPGSLGNLSLSSRNRTRDIIRLYFPHSGANMSDEDLESFLNRINMLLRNMPGNEPIFLGDHGNTVVHVNMRENALAENNVRHNIIVNQMPREELPNHEDHLTFVRRIGRALDHFGTVTENMFRVPGSVVSLNRDDCYHIARLFTDAIHRGDGVSSLALLALLAIKIYHRGSMRTVYRIISSTVEIYVFGIEDDSTTGPVRGGGQGNIE